MMGDQGKRNLRSNDRDQIKPKEKGKKEFGPTAVVRHVHSFVADHSCMPRMSMGIFK